MQSKKSLMICGIVFLVTAYCLLFYAESRPVAESGRPAFNMQDKSAATEIGLRKSGERMPEAAYLVMETAVRESGDGPGLSRDTGLSRDNGILWIDRKMSLSLITLGTLDGLDGGAFVDIYDGKVKIGKAKLIQAFDVFSYVELFTEPQGEFTKNYYTVSVH